MYKKQLRFQKIACLLAIIAAAVMFLYSLGMITDIYDSLYSTMRNPNNLLDTKVPGSIIYYDMQDFNKQMVTYSIGLILLGCLLFVTNTQVRRRYYVSNYISVALYAAASAAFFLWANTHVQAFRHQYLTTVDFEALKKYSEMWKTFYTDSPLSFDLFYVAGGLLLLAALALVFNAVWKTLMMSAEKKLIREGEEAAV
ncbi:MAG: hypothetical protein E7436_02580 [Ruminococcaceae bacterium]|nr:hypothetical protein [Oscillospiraceae bacterium]